MSGFWREAWLAFIAATPARCACPERHEVECPSCGATIRARMADAPDPKHRYEAYWRGWNDRGLAERAGVPNPTEENNRG